MLSTRKSRVLPFLLLFFLLEVAQRRHTHTCMYMRATVLSVKSELKQIFVLCLWGDLMCWGVGNVPPPNQFCTHDKSPGKKCKVTSVCDAVAHPSCKYTLRVQWNAPPRRGGIP